MMGDKKLKTLAEYRALKPFEQGYVAYMEAEWPGSELKGHDTNPHLHGTSEWKDWQAGQALGVQHAQDSEE
jgi:hypothetical protein